jgi:hypothetical protein
MSTTLPTIDTSERLIHGTILKCIDGHWSTADGDMTGTTLLVLHTVRAVQHWYGGKVLQTICEDQEELPDIEELNKAIPQNEWETGLDGTPRPPWQLQYVVYLLNTSDASLFTFLNSTVGAKIAWGKLRDRIKWMQALRGASVLPIVELASAIMKTGIEGVRKLRPEFRIFEDRWISLEDGRDGPPRINKSAPAIGKPVAPVTMKEELDDEIQF